jgi:hypothetical protein
VVSVTDPYGSILGILDRSHLYIFSKYLPNYTHEWTPFSENLVKPGIELRTSRSVARNPVHIYIRISSYLFIYVCVYI